MVAAADRDRIKLEHSQIRTAVHVFVALVCFVAVAVWNHGARWTRDMCTHTDPRRHHVTCKNHEFFLPIQAVGPFLSDSVIGGIPKWFEIIVPPCFTFSTDVLFTYRLLRKIVWSNHHATPVQHTSPTRPLRNLCFKMILFCGQLLTPLADVLTLQHWLCIRAIVPLQGSSSCKHTRHTDNRNILRCMASC